MKDTIDEFESLMTDYLKGSISPEDMKKLATLISADASCRKKYHELAEAYGMASAPWFESRKQENLELLREKLNFRSSRKRTFARQWVIWGSAAIWALIICCSITFLYLQRDNSSELAASPSYCQIEIPKGATSKLMLPDSTLVYLNGGTVLKYDASFQNKARREVFLAGEAYFSVVRNVQKPFIVHTEGLNVKVLGTTFNVASYPDDAEVKVSLVEGSVNVYTTSEAKENILLSPNEQAIYNKEHKLLSRKKIDANSAVAWTTGKLVFVNEKLFDILKTVGEKYDVQILIQSQKVYAEYFSGSIDADLTLEEVLSYLDVDNKFVWRKKGKTIVITDR